MINDLIIIKQHAKQIYSKILTRLNYEEDAAVGEYFAYRLVNAIEWGSPQIKYTKHIAKYIVRHFTLSSVSIGIIKKHFDLPY
jgi:hypothetical protein